MCKKKKIRKKKKMSDFLKAQISGMAGAIHFKSGTYSTLICQHLHSIFGPVHLRDTKLYFALRVNNLYSRCACTPWAARHTIVYLDTVLN